MRAIIPNQMPDTQIFAPIAPGFAKYAIHEFEFVEALAQYVDTTDKTVRLVTPRGSASVDYDILVVTTGTTTRGKVPWKGNGSFEHTKEDLHEVQRKVAEARTIVVGGGGATGVETCGELAYEFEGQKEIILVSDTCIPVSVHLCISPSYFDSSFSRHLATIMTMTITVIMTIAGSSSGSIIVTTSIYPVARMQ